MSDARLVWGREGGDLDLAPDDLVLDGSLVPAVLVSVFSDSRRPADPSVPVAAQDLRGWWGEEQGEQFGSLLWTLEREKLTRETIARARASVRASLQWLVDDGIAREVRVDAQVIGPGALRIAVELVRGDSPRWAALWAATEATSFQAGDVLLELVAR